MKDFLAILGVIILVCLLAFGLAFGSYELYAFFQPRYVAVQNKTFQQSQQYNEGMIRDLENIRREYLAATTQEQKDALRAIAIHRFEVYPENSLPPDLDSFYRSLNP